VNEGMIKLRMGLCMNDQRNLVGEFAWACF
jgi:hypothetical protein